MGRSVGRSVGGFVVVLRWLCGEVLVEVVEIDDCPRSKSTINQSTVNSDRPTIA